MQSVEYQIQRETQIVRAGDIKWVHAKLDAATQDGVSSEFIEAADSQRFSN